MTELIEFLEHALLKAQVEKQEAVEEMLREALLIADEITD